MGRRGPVVALALLLAPASSLRSDAGAARALDPSTDAERLEAVIRAADTPKRLNLGPYGRPYAPPPVESLLELPHFESTIEVHGKAPRDPSAAMAVWWRHFDIEPAAIYGRGTAFRQQPPQGSVDLVPLVEWLIKKVKESKGKH